jgi:hypothetical protein
MKPARHPQVSAPAASGLFVWLTRLFWAVWVAYPLFVWQSVRDILQAKTNTLAVAPDLAGCLDNAPFVTSFSTPGQWAFWLAFAVQVAIFAGLLALAHRVIASCARGEMFVAPLVAALWRIGAVIAAFPLIDLGLSNLTGWILSRTGDTAAYVPDLAFDLPVFGVGLLMLALARAMREALGLHREAALTI